MLNDWLNKFQNLFTGGGAGGGSAEGADNGRPKREAKNPLGDRGESLAARELQRLGFRIYQRNFKTPMGEIDIIAKDGATLVFVEVKTRAADDPAPEDQVNPDKMHQLTKAAKFYLGRYGDPKPPARFDVIAVVWAANQPPVIRHIKDAFEATF